MRRRGHGQIRTLYRIRAGADDHDGQATRLGGGAKARRHVGVECVDVDDGGFERKVLKRHLGRDHVAGGHRRPAQRIQTRSERPDPAIVSRQDQYARVESQANRLQKSPRQ